MQPRDHRPPGEESRPVGTRAATVIDHSCSSTASSVSDETPLDDEQEAARRAAIHRTFRVHHSFAFHPKVLAAGNAAIGLWVRAGAWSTRKETNGIIPVTTVAQLGTRHQAEQLVAAGLWHRDSDGYRFHDWPDWQPRRMSAPVGRCC